MSAFIVEDRTINIVVSFFNKVGMAGHTNDYIWAVQPLVDLGYKLDTDLGCKRLAEEMFTLNCDSVEQRYGEGQAKEFRPLDFHYQFLGSGLNRYQVLKSLRCLLYQCCEGNIPEQNQLYHALEQVSLMICYQIVTRSTEYEAAKWD
jgi:hypothetical protein